MTILRPGRSLLAALVLALLCMLAPAARAELRALLVGVSGYPDLPERLRLTGPRNDVQRMRQVLVARGFRADQIETLADGLPGAALPTRKNILAALERLAARSERGDVVVVHFAGHGSQQPSDLGTTPAGAVSANAQPQEQIFLPYDVKHWSSEQRSVANALRSRDLREAADRITARGAFLWAIFDACHSARLVRSSDNERVRYRHVPSSELGVPDGPQESSGIDAQSTTRGPTSVATSSVPLGAAALFYATQSHEVTPELPLPAGRPDARVHGLFTFIVAKALEQAPSMSYRQLAQYVVAEYRTLNDARSTPLFAGAGLDNQVLGLSGERRAQWPLQLEGESWTMPAGELAGITPGAVLAVLPNALATDRQAEGHLVVKATSAERAELVPHAYSGSPAPSRTRLRVGQFLRLVTNPVDVELRVAFDRRTCPGRCTLGDAVAQLQRHGVPGVAASWVEPGAGADIHLERIGERVVFVPTTARADSPAARADLPGISAQDNGKPLEASQLAERLATGLHALARFRNLMRTATRLMLDSPRSSLVTELQVQRTNSPRLEPVPLGAQPSLRANDRLVLTLRNEGASQLDVTVLYLDAELGITCLYPSRAGEVNRIEPKGRVSVDDITIHAPPAGSEHLLIIVTEATRLGEQRNYAFLQQAALQRLRGATEAPDAFADAAFADFRQRGASRPTPPPAQTSVRLFNFAVQR